MPVFRKVEVVDPEGEESPCYYEARIIDIKDRQILVGYENDWREATWMDASAVRNCAPPIRGDFSPEVENLVEVKARQGENEPYGWWKAKILAKSTSETGTLYMVHFEGWDDYDDVVSTEDVRPRNPSKSFAELQLDKFEIEVPTGLNPEGLDNALHRDMRDPATLYSTFVRTVSRETKKTYYIVCIGRKSTVKNARLLAKMTFKHQRERQALLKGNVEIEKRFQDQKDRLSSCKVLKLPILEGMVGLVIGKKGVNIRRALKIKGVENVQVLDKEQQIIIVAETTEAAKEAQEMLEIVKSVFSVPSELFGRFVGPRFKDVEEIRNESEVMFIRKGQEQDNKEEDAWSPGNGQDDDWADSLPEPSRQTVDLEIIGNPSKVEAARMMLSVRMKHIEESNDILNSRRTIYDQMDTLQNQYGIQGGRGRRGRGRGGRRGRRGRGGRGTGRRGAGERGNKSEENTKETPTDDGKTPTSRNRNRRNKKNRRNRGGKSAGAEFQELNGSEEGKSKESKANQASANQASAKEPEKSEKADGAPKFESKPQRKTYRRRNKNKDNGSKKPTPNGIDTKKNGNSQENTKKMSSEINDSPKEA